MGKLADEILGGTAQVAPTPKPTLTFGGKPVTLRQEKPDFMSSVKEAFRHPKQFLAGVVSGATFLEGLGRKIAPEPISAPQAYARLGGEIVGAIPTIGALEAVTGGLIPAFEARALKTAKGVARAAKLVGKEALVGATYGTLKGVGAGKPFQETLRQAGEYAVGFAPFGLGRFPVTPVGRALTAGAAVTGVTALQRRLAGDEFTTEEAVFGGLITSLPFLVGGVRKFRIPKELQGLEAKVLKATSQTGFLASLTKAEKASFAKAEMPIGHFYRATKGMAEIPPAVPPTKLVAAIPKELQPLAIEARKYKSAEEFGKKIDLYWQDRRAMGGGEPYAEATINGRYAGSIIGSEAMPIPKNAKGIARLLEQGKYGVIDSLGNPVGVFDTEIKAENALKSQLTDFYNQAVGVKPEVKPVIPQKLLEMRPIKTVLGEITDEKLVGKITRLLGRKKLQNKEIVTELVAELKLGKTPRENVLELIRNTPFRRSQKDAILRRLNATKTGGELSTALKAEGVGIEKTLRAPLIRATRKVAMDVIGSDLIASEDKGDLRRLTSVFGQKEITPRQREVIDKVISEFDYRIERGQVPDLSAYAIKSLFPLSNKTGAERNFPELVDLYSNYQLLGNLAKDKYLLNTVIVKTAVGRSTKEIIEHGLQGIFSVSKGGVGEEPLPTLERLGRAIANIPKEIALTGKTVLVSDTLLRSMGGEPLRLGVKGMIDRNWNRYALRLIAVKAMIANKVKALGLKDWQLQRVGIYGVLKQKGGLARVQASRDISPEVVADLGRVGLTKSEKEFYLFTRKIYEQHYEILKNTHLELTGKDIGYIKDYSRYLIDWDAVESATVEERLLDPKKFTYEVRKKHPPAGEAMARSEKAIPLRNYNARTVLESYVSDVIYRSEIGRPLMIAEGVVKEPAISSQLGDMGNTMIKEWVDLVARNGGVPQGRTQRILEFLRNNTSAGVLAMRLSSIIVQPSALAHGGAELGINRLLDAMIDVERNAKNIIPFIKGVSGEFALRAGGEVDLAVTQGGLEPFKKAGYLGIKASDARIAAYVWFGAYKRGVERAGQTLDLKRPVESAIQEANEVMRRTQASAIFKDLPIATGTGSLKIPFAPMMTNRSMTRAIFQFQNFLLSRWSEIYSILNGLEFPTGNKRKAVERLSWLMLGIVYSGAAGYTLNATINRLVGLDENDEEKNKQFFERLAIEALQTVPFVGSAASAIMYDSYPVPIITALGDAFEGATQIVRAKTEKGVTGGILTAAGGVGSLVGIPATSQTVSLLRKARAAGGEYSPIANLRAQRKVIQQSKTLTGAQKEERIRRIDQTILRLRTAPKTR